MHGCRLKYPDPISSPCEGIGELKYRPQKSTFNASDRELLSRARVTGGIEKSCLRHSSLFSNALTVIQKQKKKRFRQIFSSFNDDRELLSVTRVIGEIEKVFVEFIFFAIELKAILGKKVLDQQHFSTAVGVFSNQTQNI